MPDPTAIFAPQGGGGGGIFSLATLQSAYNAGPTAPQIILTSDPLTIEGAGLGTIFECDSAAGLDIFSVHDTVGGLQGHFGAHSAILSGAPAAGEPILLLQDATDSCEIWPTSRTFSSAPGALFLVPATAVHTHDYVNVSTAGVNLQHTMRQAQNGFVFNNALLFNAGLTLENVPGTPVTFGPSQMFIDQPTLRATNAACSMGLMRGFLSQPRFETVGTGTFAVTNFSQHQAFGTIGAGVTITTRTCYEAGAMTNNGGTITTENGFVLRNLAKGVTINGILSELTGLGKTFINHTGNSPSFFGGNVHMNSGIELVFGSAGVNDVRMERFGPGILDIYGNGGTNNERLRIDFESVSNNIEFTTSTSAGLQFDMPRVSFGTSTANSGDWQMLTSFGAMTLSGGSEGARRLFTVGANMLVTGAYTSIFTDIINEPGLTNSGGSAAHAGNVLIQTSVSFGTSRYGLRVTSNPSGGTENWCAAFDGAAGVRVAGPFSHTGSTLGFYNTTPVSQSPAYTPSNVVTDRTYDANSTTLDEIADVLGTLIADLQATGLIG